MPMRVPALLLACLALIATGPDTPPELATGLWELTMDAGTQNGVVIDVSEAAKSTLCVGDKNRALLAEGGAPGCSRENPVRQDDGSWREVRACEMPDGGVFQVETTITVIDADTYRMGMAITQTAGGQSKPSSVSGSTFTGRRLGACRPGEKPGDATFNGIPVPSEQPS